MNRNAEIIRDQYLVDHSQLIKCLVNCRREENQKLREVKEWNQLVGVKYYKDINIRMIPQPSYEFKFVLVGDSSVGKSSILARFVDDQFHDNLLATIGVDFKFRRIQVDAQEVKIQIWDTAGQETFRSLVSAYYHSADAILVVYDITAYNSFESVLEYWIKEAENNNRNNASIFLLGNKVDVATTKRDVEPSFIQSTLQKHHIEKAFEVSAKTGEKIEESFKEICRSLINKHRGVRRRNNEQLSRKGLNTGVHASNDSTSGSGKKKCCQ